MDWFTQAIQDIGNAVEDGVEAVGEFVEDAVETVVDFVEDTAEVVVDTDGSTWVSHCGWGQGGVYLAPLRWTGRAHDVP